MLTRCNNENRSAYNRYGGRGITVCDEWKNDFLSFYNYVIALPHYGEEGRTIDRVNSDGSYEPGNIRWATYKEQSINATRQPSKSGYVGVNWHPQRCKWLARITREGVKYHLGLFNDPKEAAIARDQFIVDRGWEVEYKLCLL